MCSSVYVCECALILQLYIIYVGAVYKFTKAENW